MATPNPEKSNLNAGWNAELYLNFIEKNKKTVLKQCMHQGPLQVQKLFYPNGNGACHVYLLHPPGGVVGGDSFDIRIDVNTNAKVLVTTPAACKFYRSEGATACQKQTIEVADHGILEWFPSENIFFSGAQAKLETKINLSDKSHFIGWDILCLGRPTVKEYFSKGSLTQRFNIFKNGRPIRLDKLIIQENSSILDAKWGFGGKPILGSFFCLTSKKELVNLLRKNIVSFKNNSLFSITFVDDIIFCRYLGNSVEQVKHNFVKAWQILSFALLDHKPVSPRIWST